MRRYGREIPLAHIVSIAASAALSSASWPALSSSRGGSRDRPAPGSRHPLLVRASRQRARPAAARRLPLAARFLCRRCRRTSFTGAPASTHRAGSASGPFHSPPPTRPSPTQAVEPWSTSSPSSSTPGDVKHVLRTIGKASPESAHRHHRPSATSECLSGVPQTRTAAVTRRTRCRERSSRTHSSWSRHITAGRRGRWSPPPPRPVADRRRPSPRKSWS